jgi:gliding motility-associated lipoprotein GldH
MRNSILMVVVAFLVLSSCDKKNIYEKHLDNERITWNRFDVKTFNVEIDEISSSYDFYVAFRHHTNFPLDFITIRFDMITPSGETRMLEQKVVLKGSDDQWLGEGMGDLWDVTHLVRDDFRFTQAGTCTIEISSTMSQADLPGILQVGLIVRKGN